MKPLLLINRIKLLTKPLFTLHQLVSCLIRHQSVIFIRMSVECQVKIFLVWYHYRDCIALQTLIWGSAPVSRWRVRERNIGYSLAAHTEIVSDKRLGFCQKLWRHRLSTKISMKSTGKKVWRHWAWRNTWQQIALLSMRRCAINCWWLGKLWIVGANNQRGQGRFRQ